MPGGARSVRFDDFRGGWDLRPQVFARNRNTFKVAENVWFADRSRVPQRPPADRTDTPTGFGETQGLIEKDGVLYVFAAPGHAAASHTLTREKATTTTVAVQVLKWSTDVWGDATADDDEWELLDAVVFNDQVCALIRHTRAVPHHVCLHVWDGSDTTLVQDPACPTNWRDFDEPQDYDATWSPRLAVVGNRLWITGRAGRVHYSGTLKPRIWNRRELADVRSEGEIYAVPYQATVGEGQVVVQIDADDLAITNPTHPSWGPRLTYRYYAYIGEYWDDTAGEWQELTEVDAIADHNASTGTFHVQDDSGSVTVSFRKTDAEVFRWRASEQSPTSVQTAFTWDLTSGFATAFSATAGTLQHRGEAFDPTAYPYTSLSPGFWCYLYTHQVLTGAGYYEDQCTLGQYVWVGAPLTYAIRGSDRWKRAIVPYYIQNIGEVTGGGASTFTAIPLEAETEWHNEYATVRALEFVGADDAGYLDLGGVCNFGGDVQAISAMKNRAAFHFADGTVLYAVDAIPENWSFLDQKPWGATAGAQPVPVDGLVVVPTQTTVRALAPYGQNSDSVRESNVGAAIEPLGAVTEQAATYWPHLGLVVIAYADADAGKVRYLVLTLSASRRIAAWSRWTLDDAGQPDVTALVPLGAQLYARRGPRVWVFDAEDTDWQDVVDTTTPYTSVLEWHFSDLGYPQARKHLLRWDVAQLGTCQLKIRPLPHLEAVLLARPAYTSTHATARMALRGVYTGLGLRLESVDAQGWELYGCELVFRMGRR